MSLHCVFSFGGWTKLCISCVETIVDSSQLNSELIWWLLFQIYNSIQIYLESMDLNQDWMGPRCFLGDSCKPHFITHKTNKIQSNWRENKVFGKFDCGISCTSKNQDTKNLWYLFSKQRLFLRRNIVKGHSSMRELELGQRATNPTRRSFNECTNFLLTISTTQIFCFVQAESSRGQEGPDMYRWYQRRWVEPGPVEFNHVSSSCVAGLPWLCSFETDAICNMEQSTGDDFDWARQTGQTDTVSVLCKN